MFKVEERVYGPKVIKLRGKEIPVYGYTCGITFDAPAGSKAMRYFQLVSGDLRTITFCIDVGFTTTILDISPQFPNMYNCIIEVKLIRLGGSEFYPKDNFNDFMKELGFEYEEPALEGLKSYAVYRTPKSINEDDATKKIQSLIDFFSTLSSPL